MAARRKFGELLGRFIAFLTVCLLTAACAPAAKSDEDLRREVQDLKKEIKALQEKVDKVQAGQQALLELWRTQAAPPLAAAAPPAIQPGLLPSQELQPPAPVKPLTVSQLLAGKDRYLGARVTVRGPVGPVMVHHKSLLLKAPEGMVEVLLGKLPDEKLVQRLTSTQIEQPLTVTGTVVLPPRPAGTTKLQINAEAVDF
jgi:outer membrane murein-binding lipoprotein Lpp